MRCPSCAHKASGNTLLPSKEEASTGSTGIKPLETLDLLPAMVVAFSSFGFVIGSFELHRRSRNHLVPHKKQQRALSLLVPETSHRTTHPPNEPISSLSIPRHQDLNLMLIRLVRFVIHSCSLTRFVPQGVIGTTDDEDDASDVAILSGATGVVELTQSWGCSAVRFFACDDSLQLISAPTWLLCALLCQQSRRCRCPCSALTAERNAPQ